MGKLELYDTIILDGFGTLYDKKFYPLAGATRLLGLIHDRSILFSNMGSMTGCNLRTKLNSHSYQLPYKILTSFDCLLAYLKSEGINKTFHYGGQQAARGLLENGVVLGGAGDDIDTMVFTSLPSSDWIEVSQAALQRINDGIVSNLILANPDRMLPGDHVGINVGMMFDMLVKNWPRCEYKLSIKEIGKPNLARSAFDLSISAKVLVIGDNQVTDGGLAKTLNADFCLISENEFSKTISTRVYRTLDNLVDDLHE